MEELTMGSPYTQPFKEDAVKYYNDHKDLGIIGCAGNYSSDQEKENARLRKELRDTQDALDILKKAISILGK